MVRFEVTFTNISLTISQHIHFITPIFHILHITHTTQHFHIININTVTRDITYFKIHCSSGKIRGK